MFLAGFLAVWIGLPVQVSGQQPPPQPQPEPAVMLETLKILVLQGQNAVNSIRDGIVTMPVAFLPFVVTMPARRVMSDGMSCIRTSDRAECSKMIGFQGL